MTRIAWSDYAKISLQEIIDFLRTQWDEEIIQKLLDLIDQRTAQLSANPYLGPKVLGTAYRMLLVHKHLSIFYTITSSKVLIVLVWDNRRDPDKFEKILDNKLLPK